MMRKQLTTVMDKIITTSEAEIDDVPSTLIDEYKDLNDKCDDVITKIRNRKKKNSSKLEVK